MNRALISNIILSVSITFILVFSVINQLYDQLWVGVLIHEGSVLVVILMAPAYRAEEIYCRCCLLHSRTYGMI